MTAKQNEQKVAFVTGAGSGIGRAICDHLAARGALAVATDVDEARANETASRIREKGAAAEAHALDVRDADAFKELVQSVHGNHGRLDYMFNNAGIAIAGEIKDYTTDDWRKVLDIDLLGVVYGVQAAYPLMIGQGSGHIVNTASIAGFVPMPGAASYTTSKFAVVGLTLCLRAEAKRYGVKVSALCPGLIDTPIFSSAERRGLTGDSLKQILNLKMQSPEECAKEAFKGIKANKAIILVPEHARALAFGYRAAPDVARWFSQKVFERARDHKDYRPA